jgi:MFS family permease
VTPKATRLPADDPRLARSRRAADREAWLSAAMTGVSDPFMIPYLLALGATPAQAGLLSSVRNALLAVVQLAAGWAVDRAGSRRRLVLITASFQALMWLPTAFAAPLLGPHAVMGVIVLYTLGTAVAALGAPAWGSLIADYIAPGERGTYFGRRARKSGVSTTIAGLAAGATLQAAGRGVTGFSLLCLGAGVTRFLSCRALARLHDVGWGEHPHLRFGFLQFLRRAPKSNFARFSLCLALSSLAAHVAAPYFAVYLLEEAGLSYVSYTVIVTGASLTGTLSTPWWGRLGDRAGNYAVLRWTLTGVALLPALWLVSESAIWLLATNVAGAFLWGGLNLSAANYVYDAVSAPRRHTCIAYFNVLNGLGVGLGALIGSRLFDATAGTAWPPYLTVFYASVGLRILASLAFQAGVREVREVHQVGFREVALDLVGQRMVALLGLFSVSPREEREDREEERDDAAA